MIPAIITTFLWSYCVIAARRSVDQLGENLANVTRIIVAVVSLGLMAHFLGKGLGGGGFLYFFLSGVVGFGFGDIGVFHALPRLGSRLTLLMSQCVAAPVAGLTEWVWMGTTIGWVQILAVGIILCGIILALAPKNIPAADLRMFFSGIAFGLLAAFGQGFGAVLSRKAYAEARIAGSWTELQSVPESLWMGATTGYQRLIGGVLVILAFFLMSYFVKAWRTFPRGSHGSDPVSSKVRFILLNAAAGPVFGIICFQWALATTPSAIVQSIIAMTPLAVIPLAWFLEGDRPSRRAFLGSLISVAGVIILAIS